MSCHVLEILTLQMVIKQIAVKPQTVHCSRQLPSVHLLVVFRIRNHRVFFQFLALVAEEF